MLDHLSRNIHDSIQLKKTFLEPALPIIIHQAKDFHQRLSKNHKLLICGNGGSAADAQHFAAELCGRYVKERKAFPAIALTTDTSAITAIGNDYGFDQIFSRQVEALGQPEDVLIVISTSGNSENCCRAVSTARRQNLYTIGLLGRDGGKLGSMVHEAHIVPSVTTARIQEVHEMILHFWCEVIDSLV